MATPLEIARLRRLIGEPTDTAPWTDAILADIIDNADDLDTAALEVWEAKAASAASMVDTAESGSSRRLSQLHEQALKMVAHYRDATAPPATADDLAGYAYTLPIERV
jgi:hypothetical protein